MSLTRFIRAYLGVTVGSGHTMVVLYEYINYSFPSSRRITTLGASLTRRLGVSIPLAREEASSTSLYRRLGLAIIPNSARMGETAASDEYAWNVEPKSCETSHRIVFIVLQPLYS